MFLIDNSLGVSNTHGIGVFANQDISSGQKVWQFNPEVDFAFSAQEWREKLAKIHPASRQQIEKYAYKTNNVYYLCTDNAQFMNHSSTPNVRNGSGEDAMYATRDIKKGEELTCDYRAYSDPDDPHLGLISE